MQEQGKRAGEASPFGFAPQNVAISNPHNVSAVYSNHLGASGTLTDFSLYFLQVGQIPGETGARQELKAAVTLPLALAEPLIQVLKQVVEGHKSALEQATAAAQASVKQ
jgi:hypothetical protein